MNEAIKDWVQKKPKFKDMEYLFPDEMDFADVSYLKRDDLINALVPQSKPADRLRAAILYNILVEEYTRRNTSTPPLRIERPPFDSYKPANMVCMHKQLLDAEFSTIKIPGKSTISSWAAEVKGWHDDALKSIKMVDLSACELFSDDSITAILPILTTFTQLEYLDMSWNRLGQDAWQGIEDDILKLPNLLYFNVVGNNSLTSTESTEQFNHLDIKLLCKLIWIPHSWVAARTWVSCLPSRPDQDLKDISDLHETFYRHFLRRIPHDYVTRCYEHIYLKSI